jgi:glutamate N-acetyltransferase/amino-acid N-acetyltransferase
VLAAVGYSGAKVDESKAEVFYGKTWAYKQGKVADAVQLKKLEAELAGPEVTVTVDLHFNNREAEIYTCDFSTEYVHINADYTT